MMESASEAEVLVLTLGIADGFISDANRFIQTLVGQKYTFSASKVLTLQKTCHDPIECKHQ
jgi:hypothetical protein